MTHVGKGMAQWYGTRFGGFLNLCFRNGRFSHPGKSSCRSSFDPRPDRGWRKRKTKERDRGLISVLKNNEMRRLAMRVNQISCKQSAIYLRAAQSAFFSLYRMRVIRFSRLSWTNSKHGVFDSPSQIMLSGGDVPRSPQSLTRGEGTGGRRAENVSGDAVSVCVCVPW